jgi:uncharacterized protein (DUF486 family)
MPAISPSVLPILMLFASNVFMTFAWYGHLKFKASPLPLVIMVSWGIAFFEYWLAVPANRRGNAVYTAAQLKTMQEVITLVVFAGFSVLYLKERWAGITRWVLASSPPAHFLFFINGREDRRMSRGFASYPVVIPAKAGIQRAVASRFYLRRSGILDRSVEPSDDVEGLRYV